MSLRVLVLASSFVLVVACGGSASNAPADAARDGSPPDVTPVDAAGARCATHRIIHFDVHPVVAGAAIPDGRLTVWFYQFNDDLMPRPQPFVAYDRPFAGTSTGVDIALDDITLPPRIEDYQLCPRTCKDLSDPACGCQGGPKLALAFVAAYVDRDGSGAIESSEIDLNNEIGEGYVQLGAADRAYAPPTVLDFVVPKGIVDCLAPYSILPPPPGESFNDLGIPDQTATFPLDVCVPGDASCDQVRRPNLT